MGWPNISSIDQKDNDKYHNTALPFKQNFHWEHEESLHFSPLYGTLPDSSSPGALNQTAPALETAGALSLGNSYQIRYMAVPAQEASMQFWILVHIVILN